MTAIVTVTRDGIIAGDYWLAIRKLERERAAAAAQQIAADRLAEYEAAVKASEEWQKQKQKLETEARLKTPKTKNKEPDKQEDRRDYVIRLYADGWGMKDIAICCDLSLTSVKSILFNGGS